MLGGLGDLMGILKSAKALQGNVQKMQAELANRRYEGISGGGMVRAVVDGRCQLVDLRIDPKAAGDMELLEDLVKGAVQVATGKAQEAIASELSTLAGGLDLPSLTGLTGGQQS